MLLRRTSVVSAAVAALLAAGCGSATEDSADNFSGESKQVAKTIDELQKAGRKRDGDKICSEVLATALVDQIRRTSKKSCGDALKETLKDVDSFDLKVVDKGITISGTTATAKVKGKSGDGDRVDTLQLVKEGQRRGGKTTQVWKLSALAG